VVFDLLSLSPKQTFAGPHPRGQSADLGYSRALRPWPVIQKSAFKDAATKLDGVRPDAARDLLSAMENNPALERAISQLPGRERKTQLVFGLRDEHRIRQDPNLRVERLVTVWNRLEHEHARTDEWSIEDADERRGQPGGRRAFCALQSSDGQQTTFTACWTAPNTKRKDERCAINLKA
jgi:hypothetical protein